MTDKDNKRFEITVLGSGTSTGVPVVGCSCSVCMSSSPYDKRLRSSLYFLDKKKKRSVLIDAGTDLRTQLLSNNISDVDYIFFTHTHADHCHGLDDIRPIFFKKRKVIKIFAAPEHKKEISDKFYYIFRDTGYLGLKPHLEFLSEKELKEDFKDIGIETASLPHGSTESTLYKLGSFIYATDFKTIPKELIQKWQGKVDLMVASAPTYKEHKTHSCVPETIEIFKKLGVKKGYLTHLSHQIDHSSHSERLPSYAAFAYDGLKLFL